MVKRKEFVQNPKIYDFLNEKKNELNLTVSCEEIK